MQKKQENQKKQKSQEKNQENQSKQFTERKKAFIDDLVGSFIDMMQNARPRENKSAEFDVRGFLKSLSNIEGDSDNDIDKVFCDCDKCLTFDTFEEMLALHERPGKFYYEHITLGDKNFRIKYWDNGEHDYLIVDEVKSQKDKTVEDLENELSQAINEQNFEEAKEILSQLNQMKKGGKQ